MKTLIMLLIILITLTGCETISSKLQEIQQIITEKNDVETPVKPTIPKELPINNATLEQEIF